jgi:hypothetical protein
LDSSSFFLLATRCNSAAAGVIFLAGLFVLSGGTALCFWLFTIKNSIEEKTKAMCRLWVGQKA